MTLTADGSLGYGWDSRNRLVSLTGAATASFAYDALGRRNGKTINGTATNFLYDGASVVQELASGTPSANLLTGLGVDEVFSRTDGLGTRSFVTDALGSTVALTDGSGAVKTSYAYEPYGNTTTSGEANGTASQYTGRENDGTGLYYYRARYYNPGFGRFVAQDPIGLAGGFNVYAYANANPALFTDPSGLWTRQIGLSVGFTAFGVSGTAFAGVAYDSDGNVGSYYGWGGGSRVGGGWSGGLSLGASNAQTICDLRGPFGNASVGAGAGTGATVDGFWGESDHGDVVGGSATFGPSLGVTSFNGITNTYVRPLR